jgi:hypothetical protein
LPENTIRIDSIRRRPSGQSRRCDRCQSCRQEL